MLCNGISIVTQFIVVMFWLSAVIYGESNSSVVTNETKHNLFFRPFPGESKRFRYAKLILDWPTEPVIPTIDEIPIPERSTSAKNNNVPSVIGFQAYVSNGSLIEDHSSTGPSPAVVLTNETSKTSENRAAQSEFSSSTELMGGAGLQLFGVTNSFVNPGAVLSASIESGLEKLTELVGSIGNITYVNTTTEVPQFFGIGSPPGTLETPSKLSHSPHLYPNHFPSVQNGTVAQFFGIANIYVGDDGQHHHHIPDCHTCPPPVLHDVLTVSVTACESLTSFGVCSVASVAPSGTLLILFPAEFSGARKLVANYFRTKKKKRFSTVSAVIITIRAKTPDTKITVTCPSIPSGISVKTQNGSILPFKSREETGYVQLKVTGNASSPNVAVACVWKSKP